VHENGTVRKFVQKKKGILKAHIFKEKKIMGSAVVELHEILITYPIIIFLQKKKLTIIARADEKKKFL